VGITPSEVRSDERISLIMLPGRELFQQLLYCLFLNIHFETISQRYFDIARLAGQDQVHAAACQKEAIVIVGLAFRHASCTLDSQVIILTLHFKVH
jgi:hypothetical protein